MHETYGPARRTRSSALIPEIEIRDSKADGGVGFAITAPLTGNTGTPKSNQQKGSMLPQTGTAGGILEQRKRSLSN